MAKKDHRPRITGGFFKGRPLIGGVPRGVRPTSARVREALGSLLGAQWQGARVLDLFSGAGTLAAEALSRGAMWVVAVDKAPLAGAAIRRSLSSLGEPQALNPEDAVDRVEGFLVVPKEALAYLRRGRPEPWEGFDIALIDPPYAEDLAEQALPLLVAGEWLREGAVVVVETSTRQPPPSPPATLAFLDARRYGDTQLALYVYQPQSEPPSPGGSNA